jgi:nucleotide-binding universal stress UspA family protein
MMMLKRILCPVDFSDPSKRALRYALAIARWHESELTVLHVESALHSAATVEAGSSDELTARHHEVLQEFVNDAGGGNQSVNIDLVINDTVSGILDHASRERSDLIVMGTRGRSGLARAVLGSVAESVVRESPTPVLTIPPSAEWREDPIPFNSILCASDFSPACRKALEMAMVIGQEADARLILLHALQLPAFDTGTAPVPLPMASPIDVVEFRKEALARLTHALPVDAAFRFRPEPVVADGLPADVILGTAAREGVRLIVMGVQARGTLDRLIFGSTTRRVMQAATCPVLSVRAGDAAEPWPA